jgi:hypothetical protein
VSTAESITAFIRKCASILRANEGVALISVYSASVLICFFYVTQDLHRTCVFADDQAKNALVVLRMYYDKSLPLLGTHAGFGGHYFGPAYFYLLLLPYLLFDFDPLAGAYFTCLFNLICLALLCGYASRTLRLGILPLAVFWALSLSSTMFYVLRTQWSPHVLPGIACLLMLTCISAVTATKPSRKTVWYALSGLLLAASLQIHATTFCLGPTVAAVFLYDFLLRARTRGSLLPLLLPLAVSVFCFLLLFIPTLIDGVRTEFANMNKYLTYVRFYTRPDPYTWENLRGNVDLIANVWRGFFGKSGLWFLIATSVAGLVVVFRHTRYPRHTASAVFSLFVLAMLVFFVLGYLRFSGYKLEYWYSILYELPLLSLFSLALMFTGRSARRYYGLLLAVLAVSLIPFSLEKNEDYLRERPEFCHYDELLQIVDYIQAEAGDEPFGVYFQDRYRRNPVPFFYHFERLNKVFGREIQYGPAEEQKRIYLIVNNKERMKRRFSDLYSEHLIMRLERYNLMRLSRAE